MKAEHTAQRERIIELEKELSVLNAFYHLVVKERDFERHQVNSLRAELGLAADPVGSIIQQELGREHPDLEPGGAGENLS